MRFKVRIQVDADAKQAPGTNQAAAARDMQSNLRRTGGCWSGDILAVETAQAENFLASKPRRRQHPQPYTSTHRDRQTQVRELVGGDWRMAIGKS